MTTVTIARALHEMMQPAIPPFDENFEAKRAARRLARARRINAETHDRRVMLKIKLIDLAQEARTIRREEQLRHGGWLRTELRDHRTKDLRREARATHLAYGFLRGKPLETMERGHTVVEPHLRERIRAMLKKFGPASFVEPPSMRA